MLRGACASKAGRGPSAQSRCVWVQGKMAWGRPALGMAPATPLAPASASQGGGASSVEPPYARACAQVAGRAAGMVIAPPLGRVRACQATQGPCAINRCARLLVAMGANARPPTRANAPRGGLETHAATQCVEDSAQPQGHAPGGVHPHSPPMCPLLVAATTAPQHELCLTTPPASTEWHHPHAAPYPHAVPRHGRCTAPESCSCYHGWGGGRCSTPMCQASEEGYCSGHGLCAGPEKCSCMEGYVGATCSTPVCHGKTEGKGACGGHGQCREVRGGYEHTLCVWACG